MEFLRKSAHPISNPWSLLVAEFCGSFWRSFHHIFNSVYFSVHHTLTQVKSLVFRKVLPRCSMCVCVSFDCKCYGWLLYDISINNFIGSQTNTRFEIVSPTKSSFVTLYLYQLETKVNSCLFHAIFIKLEAINYIMKMNG